MCLWFDSTVKGRAKKIANLFKDKDVIICYKIMSLNIDSTTQKKYLKSLIYNGIAKLQKYFRSNRRNNKFTKQELEYGNISKGIHVYLSFPNDIRLCHEYCIKCLGFRPDIVAANSHQAVFTKVLPIEYYNSQTKQWESV